MWPPGPVREASGDMKLGLYYKVPLELDKKYKDKFFTTAGIVVSRKRPPRTKRKRRRRAVEGHAGRKKPAAFVRRAGDLFVGRRSGLVGGG